MKFFSTRFTLCSFVLLLSSTSLFAAASTEQDKLVSGIELKNKGDSIRPQDDFYSHVNGNWMKNTEIPADKPSWNSFSMLANEVTEQLHLIITDLAKDKNIANGSDAQKIRDLYESFMNTEAIDKLELTPLKSVFAQIDAIDNKDQLPELIGRFSLINITVPFDIGIHQDNKDSTKYVIDLSQSGLGLPDRDYYLNEDDAKLKDLRNAYQKHIETMLTMTGEADAAKNAAAILQLETALAKIQWSKVEQRDPVKLYNKIELANLNKLTPDFSLTSYLKAVGAEDKVTYVIISQPSYFTGFAKVLDETPLATWKTYFKWHTLSKNALYLPAKFADEHFAFFSTKLRGVPEQELRWKRAIRLINRDLGEALGKLYVAKYFPPEYKARMEKLVGNLLVAYKHSINDSDWMGPNTKKEAQIKLATFMPKIAYPAKWLDYSALTIKKDELIANNMRSSKFKAQYEINKLGKPIDRSEWQMTPQMVNAYYNPEMNEIVFPAAILQPPFFNAKADDAVNYGAIGTVIGHEISHGFDDEGSQYDEKGNLRDWWTKEDHKKFKVKTATLVKQYNAFSPMPGYFVNGELTLGENIADNAGLAIAYKAYKISLDGKPAPVIDGLTGEQRLYMGFGQVWRDKTRDETRLQLIKIDPHAPGEFRANGTVRNQPGFYKAFGVKEGDKMYIAPEDRVIIW